MTEPHVEHINFYASCDLNNSTLSSGSGTDICKMINVKPQVILCTSRTFYIWHTLWYLFVDTVCRYNLFLSHTHLTGAEDDAVLILVLQIFGIVQFLSTDAQSHRPQLLISTKVVPVLWVEKANKQKKSD